MNQKACALLVISFSFGFSLRVFADQKALCKAVHSRNKAAVEAALAAGDIDLNAEKQCHPPLMIAAEGGEIEIAKLLLSKGAKLVVQGEMKVHDALVYAANGEAFQRKKRELGHAYQESDKDKRRDNSEMIEFLISKGAQVNPAPRFSKNAEKYRREATDQTREAQRINNSVTQLTDADDRDETPLLTAASHNRLYNLKTLLAQGADPKVRVFGVTPLIAAARDFRVGMVEALLAAGAPKDQPGVRGETALQQVQKKRPRGAQEQSAKDRIIELLSH